MNTKVVMNENGLPDWFLLSNYKENLTEEEWLDELLMRVIAKTIYENTQDKKKTKELFIDFVVKKSLHGKEAYIRKDRKLKEVWPVRMMTVFDMSYLYHLSKESENVQALMKNFSEIKDGKDMCEFLFKSNKMVMNSKNMECLEGCKIPGYLDGLAEVIHGVPLTVDMDFDDDSLIEAFKVWLIGFRNVQKSIQGKNHKIYPNSKCLDQLFRYSVLPAFDLIFWGRLTNPFTDVFVAKALWPDDVCGEEFDREERLRKTTKPRIEAVINWNFIGKLAKNIEIQRAAEKIRQEELE